MPKCEFSQRRTGGRTVRCARRGSHLPAISQNGLRDSTLVTNVLKAFAPRGGGGALACLLARSSAVSPVKCCPGPRKLGMRISAKARVAAWPHDVINRCCCRDSPRPWQSLEGHGYCRSCTLPRTSHLQPINDVADRLSRPWAKRPGLRFQQAANAGGPLSSFIPSTHHPPPTT